MPDLSDLADDALTQAATDGVAAASVDGQSVTATPIPDLIALDQYAAAKEAAAATASTGVRRSGWSNVFARGVTEGLGRGHGPRFFRGGRC